MQPDYAKSPVPTLALQCYDAAMARIYYDLSEQFLASGQKFKYYGISRTVMEVGYELAHMDADVGFVIFSPAHGQFFEVTPRVGAASPTGVLDPGLPPGATPKRMRLSFPTKNAARDALYPAVLWAIRQINLKRWRHVPVDAVRDVDLTGQILVSLGRPKIMNDYLTALNHAGVTPRFFPLLHDMIPLHGAASKNKFSSNFVHDNHVVIKNAAGLISNSAFTKGEIEHFAALGHLPAIPPVTAVPLGHELRPTNEPVHKTGPDAPYLIGVGLLTGRKNLEAVIGAMMHLHTTGRPVPHLVLAGAHRKRTEAYINRKAFEAIRNQIHTVLNPNQAELRGLYKNALALVIPSHMEGWGLPLGEALWMGTPGLASTAPALREAGGTLAQYFKPDDAITLAGYIDALHTDPAHREKQRAQIAAGRDQLRAWRDVAHDIVRAITP
jgi:glycosyltransferase involved in cell wall biosynthesis